MNPVAKVVAFLLLIPLLAVACGGSAAAKPRQLGDLSFNDKGTRDLSKATSVKIAVDSYYFSPTFIRGAPGQQVELTVTSGTKDSLHNFSIPSLAIDQDVQPNGSVDVDFTFPQSGVLVFLCKYHSSQGMNGELLAGNAQPQAASADFARPTIEITGHITPGSADYAPGQGQSYDILTDVSGRTLYIDNNDVRDSGKSVVSGSLAKDWPPLTVADGDPVKGPGLSAAIGLISRDDGSKQVTYGGLPLYYYVGDLQEGDANGNGIDKFYLATAHADNVDVGAVVKANQVDTVPDLAVAAATYRGYVVAQVGLLLQGVTGLRDAIANGDLQGARVAYIAAHPSYERIQAIANAVGVLDPAIDERAGDTPAEGLSGFHRLEYGLWAQNSTGGLNPAADQLVQDVTTLQGQITAAQFDSSAAAGSAIRLLGLVTMHDTTGDSEPYSHLDLIDLQAHADGAKAAFDALHDSVTQRDIRLADTIDQRFDNLYAALAAYQQSGGYLLSTALTASDTQLLGQKIDALGEALSQVPQTLSRPVN